MGQCILDVVVIGAGLTGLSAGHTLLKNSSLEFILLEEKDRAGGQIRTHYCDGFTYEEGPNTGIISTVEAAELFEDFPHLLQTARAEAKRRLILKEGKFRPLPSGLVSALTTELFTWKDKLRILGEPFRAKGSDPYESVASLVYRRLGKSYYTYAVNPFVGGIYAGDPDKLVTKYALPKLYALEEEHGSFIRGAIALSRKHKTAREKKATKEVFSAVGGLSALTDAIADELIADNKLHLGAKGIKVFYDDNHKLWHISYTYGSEEIHLEARGVLFTIGTEELSHTLMEDVDFSAITSMRYAPVVQVAVGYNRIGYTNFDAFGGLIPSCEDREVLGILNPSASFDNRCPKGGLLLSVFLGGMRSPELIEQSDEYILALVKDRLHRFMGIVQVPDLIHIFRHQRAIPQYEASSATRFEWIKSMERRYAGLALGGNMLGGIGMSDRIKQGVELANRFIRNSK